MHTYIFKVRAVRLNDNHKVNLNVRYTGQRALGRFAAMEAANNTGRFSVLGCSQGKEVRS